ncbi:MAG: transporter substrate-binding domain-containing protein [Clostridiales bacterium]|nr:transporter substrate-binding domain-containing protein [Clostridiales bacterium]
MNFKRFAAAFAAAALCLSALAGCSQNKNDLLSQIKDKGEITVAMEGTWAPWGYHDENNDLVGYDVEVAQNIADKLGVKVNFVEGTWDACLAGLEGGRYDIMVNGVDVDESRKEKYDFSTPYAYNRTVVITRADDGSIQAMEDLDGKTTANTLQSTYEAVGLKYGATVTPVDDFIQTIELLTSGRIDATLNAEVSYYDYMAQHPDAPVKIACIDSEVTQVAIPMRKGEETASLREAIDKALAEMAQDGTLTELSIKYFGTDISQN